MANCQGLHCRCMNLDGRCPNPHYGDHDCPHVADYHGPPRPRQEEASVADPKAPKQADPPKPPPKAPDPPDRRTTWAHTGEYPALYFLPDRTSRYINPGEVVDWGEHGPPDGHWERADPPTKTDDAKEA